MGIFGALTNAVTGLRAQSYALENISGNIANSQTTAFKRIDTSFQDLIPDAGVNRQLAGSVVANSRANNSVQGDIQSAATATFMAVNGEGFFVVSKPSGFVDNRPVFDGANLYTRRGDYQMNKDGYLVNGSGYYLMGVPVDPTTGNLVGSTPQLLQFNNDFLPAQATSQIQYRANLAALPLTANYDAGVPGSELLNPATMSANPLVGAPVGAQITGFGASVQPDARALGLGTVGSLTALTTLNTLGISNGQTVTVNDGTSTTTYTVVNAATETVGALVTVLDTGTAAVGVTLSSGQIRIQSDNFADTVTVGGTGAASAGFGSGNTVFPPVNLLSQTLVSSGQTLTVNIGGNISTINFGPGQVFTLAGLATALGGLTAGSGSVDANGNITITATNPTHTITLGSGPTEISPINFGIHVQSAMPADLTVRANDLTAFLNQSLGGGEITAYDAAGAAANMQLRWAKTDSKAGGGSDTWELFYQEDSTATGTEVAWRNAGVRYTFGPDGRMNPPITSLTLDDVVVNGIALGDIQIAHGLDGMTQFADPNGTAQVNLLQQNGYAAGSLQTVAVNEKGRISGSYSNGRTIDLAEITLADFKGPDMLRRLDGGAFEATEGSGPAFFGASGKVLGNSLEGSNTDIADEFTKLIVTQQAYSANTRIVTTSNEMVQDLLNMLR
jgi:flagellar hook protein FlgE